MYVLLADALDLLKTINKENTFLFPVVFRLCVVPRHAIRGQPENIRSMHRAGYELHYFVLLLCKRKRGKKGRWWFSSREGVSADERNSPMIP